MGSLWLSLVAKRSISGVPNRSVMILNTKSETIHSELSLNSPESVSAEQFPVPGMCAAESHSF